MIKLRFSHISDIHLGLAQYGSSEREQDIYDVFEQAIEKSIDDKVEFVIFSGDIFDEPNPKGRPQIKLANALLRLSQNGIKSYFVLGEHDINNIKDTPVPFVFNNLGFTKYLENGKPILHNDVMIVGLDKFRKKEIHLFKEKFSEIDEIAKKHHGPKILVLHQGITEINKFAGEVNSTDLPKNFNYYAMGHLHDKFEKKFDHLNGPLAYPGSIELTTSEGIKETQKGFYEVEISESETILNWIPLNIRPQISMKIDFSKLDENLPILSEKIKSCKRKPIVKLEIQGQNIDYDVVESKILPFNCDVLHLSLKIAPAGEQSYQLLSEKPSIDVELFKLATKYLKNEELANFATKDLLPIFENKDIDAAAQLVIKNYEHFRSEKID